MSRRANPTLVGAFVLGAVILLFVGVTLFGSGMLFRKTFPFVCYFKGDISGLNVGAPVKFNGVEIGAVTSIGLRFEPQTESVRIPVHFEIDATKVGDAGGPTEFSRENIDRAIAKGLRAQLATQSLVTGLFFVQLSFQPNTPANFVNPSAKTQEIPTVPTPLEQAQSALKELMVRLDKVDFDGLINSLHGAAAGIDQFMHAPELKQTLVSLNDALTSIRGLSDTVRADVGPVADSLQAMTSSARVTLTEFDQTARKARGLLADDSPLAYQLGKTLEDLASAARSVRLLADYLERNPGAIVRGRSAEGENQ
jgi:phospholipid/cholesterol/gamma-HCH transport system substrate-binding protein